MSDQYLGEIRAFAGNYAPTGWALCNGQLLPIGQNVALFSLLGAFYGGDGRSTFALPDLIGATPIHAGYSSSGTEYYLGETGGVAEVTLIDSEIPIHVHQVAAAAQAGERNSPAGAVWAQPAAGRVLERAYATATDGTVLHEGALAPGGGAGPHNNMPPFLVVTYIIALQGAFPLRPDVTAADA